MSSELAQIESSDCWTLHAEIKWGQFTTRGGGLGVTNEYMATLG